MRLILIFAILFWKQSSSTDSICQQYLKEDLEDSDGFCLSKDLLGKKLEDDLEINDLKNLKKCCGASDNFKYECVR